MRGSNPWPCWRSRSGSVHGTVYSLLVPFSCEKTPAVDGRDCMDPAVVGVDVLFFSPESIDDPALLIIYLLRAHRCSLRAAFRCPLRSAFRCPLRAAFCCPLRSAFRYPLRTAFRYRCAPHSAARCAPHSATRCAPHSAASLFGLTHAF
jgi:hypothetical protein